MLRITSLSEKEIDCLLLVPAESKQGFLNELSELLYPAQLLIEPHIHEILDLIVLAVLVGVVLSPLSTSRWYQLT
jgi:hypothetical protein